MNKWSLKDISTVAGLILLIASAGAEYKEISLLKEEVRHLRMTIIDDRKENKQDMQRLYDLIHAKTGK